MNTPPNTWIDLHPSSTPVEIEAHLSEIPSVIEAVHERSRIIQELITREQEELGRGSEAISNDGIAGTEELDRLTKRIKWFKRSKRIWDRIEGKLEDERRNLEGGLRQRRAMSAVGVGKSGEDDGGIVERDKTNGWEEARERVEDEETDSREETGSREEAGNSAEADAPNSGEEAEKGAEGEADGVEERGVGGSTS